MQSNECIDTLTERWYGSLRQVTQRTRAYPHVSPALKRASRNLLASRSRSATVSSSDVGNCNSFKACWKTSGTASGLLLAQNPTAAIMYQGLTVMTDEICTETGFELTTTGILGINGLETV
jgi:hypothetical protein